MRTVEITITVAEDGKATTQVPPDAPPGEHRAVIVMSAAGAEFPPETSLELPAWPWYGWPADSTLAREDLYCDDTR